MRNINVRRCQTVPTPAPPSSTRYPGQGSRTWRKSNTEMKPGLLDKIKKLE